MYIFSYKRMQIKHKRCYITTVDQMKREHLLNFEFLNIFYMDPVVRSVLCSRERKRLFKRAPFPSYFWTVDSGSVSVVVYKTLSVCTVRCTVVYCTVRTQVPARCLMMTYPQHPHHLALVHIVLTAHPPVHSREISQMMIPRPHT